eukprot:1837781-Alexandrium_andersonii.AAC.1
MRAAVSQRGLSRTPRPQRAPRHGPASVGWALQCTNLPNSHGFPTRPLEGCSPAVAHGRLGRQFPGTPRQPEHRRAANGDLPLDPR